VVKVRYKKDDTGVGVEALCEDNAVYFAIVETEPVVSTVPLYDPLTGRVGFKMFHTDKKDVSWKGTATELSALARTLAKHNGRKNVVDTTPESGVLY